jgi:hypothetical protein
MAPPPGAPQLVGSGAGAWTSEDPSANQPAYGPTLRPTGPRHAPPAVRNPTWPNPLLRRLAGQPVFPPAFCRAIRRLPDRGNSGIGQGQTRLRFPWNTFCGRQRACHAVPLSWAATRTAKSALCLMPRLAVVSGDEPEEAVADPGGGLLELVIPFSLLLLPPRQESGAVGCSVAGAGGVGSIAGLVMMRVVGRSALSISCSSGSSCGRPGGFCWNVAPNGNLNPCTALLRLATR